jgi:hypothetical protein
VTKVEYLVILTVVRMTTSTVQYTTLTRAIAVGSGASRLQIFDWALKQLPEEWRGANVVFFSAEPNLLTPAPVEVPASAGGAT